ncbi:MAG: PD40 domain-containing protein [Bacteroidetes bacterium]|nr:PD40 domain-containing protein [Bacteroidota bacterium]
MKLIFTSPFLLVSSYLFCQLPDCDIWLLDIKDSVGRISFHNPVNITSRKGYDNQPAFSPDGKYILFSSQHDSAGQTDIYKYELATKKITQFTHTPTSEYSPTFIPDGKNISVVMVEKDSAQRLWKFSLSPLKAGNMQCGGCACIMQTVDSVGYHCWINKDSVAIFVLTKPSFTLQLANINSQKTQVIADSIGRCMRMKEGTLWFTTKVNHFHNVYEYNLKTKKITAKGAIESEDYCFYGNQIWSCSENTIVSGYMNNKIGSNRIMNLDSYGIMKITRITLSPDGKKIALVSNK